ncbi:MAG TPA: hydroxymethylpyrimidine/phosphomethylpyrimidine kinase [Crocinitomicaceae bacterium]|nr:hydroxymethylpyrimidine/phosphomethylpyrimidine kinase [Crocinitomicaceae bacterium]
MALRPHILTIAGFDPSNGAGLTADVKTFEKLKCYGLSVCTAVTVQNDVDFKECHWTNFEVIESQINILFERFEIKFVKIGIVENWSILNRIIDLLLSKNSKIKIILDPILKSSSNFEFHQDDVVEFDEILSKIYLLTPNYLEIENLYNDKSIKETILHIQSKTNLFLKGGHRPEKVGTDELFTKEGKQFIFKPKSINISEKHGSGCVLSSAITSYLIVGFPIVKSCYKAKRYTEIFLASNKSKLGYNL